MDVHFKSLLNFSQPAVWNQSGNRIRGPTQSGTGMLRYRTEIQDAGMPMPAASTSMPMPSYANGKLWGWGNLIHEKIPKVENPETLSL
jgi:hypothetical protein